MINNLSLTLTLYFIYLTWIKLLLYLLYYNRDLSLNLTLFFNVETLQEVRI